MIPYRKHSHVNKVWCDGCNVSKVWKKDMFCVDTNRNEDLLNRVNDDKRHQHDTSCCKKYTLHYAWFAWHTLHRCTCTHHISHTVSFMQYLHANFSKLICCLWNLCILFQHSHRLKCAWNFSIGTKPTPVIYLENSLLVLNASRISSFDWTMQCWKMRKNMPNGYNEYCGFHSTTTSQLLLPIDKVCLCFFAKSNKFPMFATNHSTTHKRSNSLLIFFFFFYLLVVNPPRFFPEKQNINFNSTMSEWFYHENVTAKPSMNELWKIIMSKWFASHMNINNLKKIFV